MACAACGRRSASSRVVAGLAAACRAPARQAPTLETLLAKAAAYVPRVRRASSRTSSPRRATCSEIDRRRAASARCSRTSCSSRYPGRRQWHGVPRRRSRWTASRCATQRGRTSCSEAVHRPAPTPCAGAPRSAATARATTCSTSARSNNPLLAMALPAGRLPRRASGSTSPASRRSSDPTVRTRAVRGIRAAVASSRAAATRTSCRGGLVWIDEDTGRVVKTELQIGPCADPRRSRHDTYQFDEELGIDVPVEMRDWYPDGTRRDSRRGDLRPVPPLPGPHRRSDRRSVRIVPTASLDDADVRQVAVLLGVVEPVADDELVLDREADVLDLHVDLAARRLAQQAGRPQACAAPARAGCPAGR